MSLVSPVNEGRANLIAVQRESTLGGSLTGTAYSLPGRIQFNAAPLLAKGANKVNVWRQSGGDSFHVLSWAGTIDMEYAHSEIIRVFVETMFELVSTTADTPLAGLTTYYFRPKRLASIKSIAISLQYVSGMGNLLFAGCVIDLMRVTVLLRQIVKVHFEFKALTMTSSTISGTALTYSPLNQSNVGVTVNGANFFNLTEANWTMQHRVKPGQFKENKTPGRFNADGQADWNGELAMYYQGDDIPSFVRAQTETPVIMQLLAPGSRSLNLYSPRSIWRAGTPQGLGDSDIVFRGNFETQHDDGVTVNAEPRLILVL